MLTVHSTARDIGDAWSRTCDTCRTAASTVYCRADLAYLCASCDARVHAANQVASRHERVWVLCEACERAPAEFICKADSASLCSACDADIHSANPLARRHHRVPITQNPGNPGGLIIGRSRDAHDGEFLTVDGEDTNTNEDEDETASWLLLNNKGVFGEEVDEYLDLEEYTSYPNDNNQINYGYAKQAPNQYSCDHDHSSYGGDDSVVPIQFQKGFETFSAPSISQTVSPSSTEVGVVPESAITQTRPPKGTIDLFSGPLVQVPAQVSGMDREARVQRYKEKKKNRKFEKTIRYASRKAYAETRPRIKGRFAKRTNVEVEVDQMFSMHAYGIVPSF